MTARLANQNTCGKIMQSTTLVMQYASHTRVITVLMSSTSCLGKYIIFLSVEGLEFGTSKERKRQVAEYHGNYLLVNKRKICYIHHVSNLAENRKARFNYEFVDEYEAGIELLGHEVRAVRTGKMTLEGAHVTVRGGEAFLVGATIAPYQVNNTPKGYEQTRVRKLLLTKKELADLEQAESKKGLTIVPISVYNKDHRIKVRIAVARGKKKFDKRASIRKRDDEREIMREMRDR